MARVYCAKFPEGSGHLYTVDKRVGMGGVNNQDDVLLVQFFLHAAMLPGRDGGPGYKPPGERPIKIDGMNGPQTIRYIKYFQAEGNRRNPRLPTVVDGRVDPIVGGKMFGTVQDEFMTILALNTRYRAVKGYALHADIRQDPDFPPRLIPSLYV